MRGVLVQVGVMFCVLLTWFSVVHSADGSGEATTPNVQPQSVLQSPTGAEHEPAPFVKWSAQVIPRYFVA